MSPFQNAKIRRALVEPKTSVLGVSLLSTSGIVLVALLAAQTLASPALAGSYTATDDASLRAAIASANADPDPSATITLQNDVAMTAVQLPLPAKPITIDTNGHIYTSVYQNGATLSGAINLNNGLSSGGGSYILNGTFQAATAGAGANGNGDLGIYMNQGKIVTNNGTITGGAGGGLGGNGGTGVAMSGSTGSPDILTNAGTITGGSAVNGNGGTGVSASTAATVNNSGTIRGGDGLAGGVGLRAISNPLRTMTNSGTIQGGNGSTGAGGDGVQTANGLVAILNDGTILGGDGVTGGWGINIIGTANNTTPITNHGTIRGGNGNGGTGGNAIIVHTTVGTMINTGSIIGGANAAAIMNTGIVGATNAPVSLINSGTIQAGAGFDTAILMQVPSNLTLELHQGSVINGKVVGNTGAAANSLILGGDDNDSFDVSAVGPQYQNFNVFQKTGNSVWSLTGTGTVATPWTITSGTLQLGNGTTDGSMIGDVTDNAVFSFNNNGSTTYAGTVSGTGALVQAGSGTTILTGTNTYGGGTTISAGTLQIGNGGAAGSITGDVTDNGALAFNRSDTVTWSNIASGSGKLIQAGSGSLILTGANSYSGGTTISAGALQIGAGGTAGSITGAVIDNGVLVFDRSDAVTFAGAISGTGSVSQIAASNLTLTGTNTYSGGTTIAAGTVTGSATSFGSGTILNNTALVIDQPADGGMANALNGTGSFTKRGAGRLNLTGSGNLSGATTVAAGTLAVNGSLVSSAVTVQSGGALGGNGTVGATSIQAGGAIAPGNSIGTLHINGAFVQAAGSTYQLEVDPNSNAADLIAVNGTATVQNGAGLTVTKYTPGDYRLGTVYRVLSASGGLNGTYTVSGQTSSVSAFLALKDSYDANNAYLTVVQTQTAASAAQTTNQQAVAQSIDSLAAAAPGSNAAVNAVLNTQDGASARAAFDQLSGQSQASAQAALLGNGLYVRDVAFDRLRDVVCVPGTAERSRCNGKGLSIWEQGFGGWGGIAGNANAAGLNHSSAGFLVGADVPVDDWRLGFFGGYSHADFHLTSGGSAGGGSDDYHLGAYGGTLLGDVALRLGGSYSWNGVTTDRAVLIGTFRDALHGIYNGGTTQVFGELATGMAMDDIMLEPFANLTYVGLSTDGFTEAGGPAALTVRANTTENMIATLGMRPSMDVNLGGLGGTLRGMLGWRHTFGGVTPDAQVSFAGGNVFGVSGVSIARDAAALEAGLDVSLMEDVSFGLTYGGQFSGKSTDQTARGTIRVNF